MEVKLQLGQKQCLTAAMQTSVHILQLGNLQLGEYVRELLHDNAVVELHLPEEALAADPFERHWPDAAPRSRWEGGNGDGERCIPDRAGAGDPWDLRLQIAALKLRNPQKYIIRYLADSLDPNGYLTEDDAQVAQFLGVEEEIVARCTKRLQSLEPAGIGARNLRECLLLQLRQRAPGNKTATRIVETCLELLAKRKFDAIARALCVPLEEVERASALIRSLNPKPLNGTGGETFVRYAVPDFYVVEQSSRFHCVMNDRILPRIVIDETYRDFLRQKDGDAARSYLQKSFLQANEVSRYIGYRTSTLARVAGHIVACQHDFFLHGPGHRAAMSNREVAEALNLHESTISRAVNEKYFECKWGLFPLKSLFSHSVRPCGCTEEIDYDRILRALRSIIAQEKKGAAYSDQKIAELLRGKGISLSRRTISKYRQMLDIPHAAERNKTHPDHL